MTGWVAWSHWRSRACSQRSPRCPAPWRCRAPGQPAGSRHRTCPEPSTTDPCAAPDHPNPDELSQPGGSAPGVSPSPQPRPVISMMSDAADRLSFGRARPSQSVIAAIEYNVCDVVDRLSWDRKRSSQSRDRHVGAPNSPNSCRDRRVRIC